MCLDQKKKKNLPDTMKFGHLLIKISMEKLVFTIFLNISEISAYSSKTNFLKEFFRFRGRERSVGPPPHVTDGRIASSSLVT